jgi:ectoine hydroxylase-related dioxygenase (phytanoyl-CoA dioxygenase family)
MIERGRDDEKPETRKGGKMAPINHPMNSTLTAPSLVAPEQQQQFKDEGYFILKNCVSSEHLELLRSHCGRLMEEIDAVMEAEGVERIGIAAKGKRYFMSGYEKVPALGRFIFSDLMADICRATLGDEAYLFWDQYVVKGTDKDTSFAWHQDSGYVHHECPMYLTCWVTLDDVSLENGTVYLLPYSEVGIRSVVQHIKDPRTHDMVGYFGKNPGVAAIVPAGSIVVFSSYVFHRSGPNLTDKIRRVYLPQYSSAIIRDLKGKQWGQAVPFLKNGENVWRE